MRERERKREGEQCCRPQGENSIPPPPLAYKREQCTHRRGRICFGRYTSTIGHNAFCARRMDAYQPVHYGTDATQRVVVCPSVAVERPTNKLTTRIALKEGALWLQ